MNKTEYDILNVKYETSCRTQRDLAEACQCSLGSANKGIKALTEKGYIDDQGRLTEKSTELQKQHRSKRAVLLAAGNGTRMAPINLDTPKALVEVNGETLIERLIRQLHEADVYEIYVVVGFKKEQFEYLIDQYQVKLVVNPEYAVKNNLYSLRCAAVHLSDCYIVPCDLWCRINPFHKQEFYDWYMVSDRQNEKSTVSINREGKLRITQGGSNMLGISYVTAEGGKRLQKAVDELCRKPAGDTAFWEEAFFKEKETGIYAKIIKDGDAVEINTYEQLRNLDKHSKQLENQALQIAAQVLHVRQEEIGEIKALKKGMTNRSFRFCCCGKKYMMRIPGEGTEKLIDRGQEAAVYEMIKDRNLCDRVLYVNPQNGYKITEYIEKTRVCDPASSADIRICMKKLREFHESKLTVSHRFDLFERILFYENLWKGKPSAYRDYEKTKKQVFLLKHYIDSCKIQECLTHIDAVPDNFLIQKQPDGKEKVFLIDWEYAAMQDPHVDIAMFAIYALYKREQVDTLIDTYFTEGCSNAVRLKIYCYIAVCGLLWSNWCEYKRQIGVEFGEYSLRQYRYAKEYTHIVRKELGKEE